MSAAHVLTRAIPAKHRDRSVRRVKSWLKSWRDWMLRKTTQNRTWAGFYFGFVDRSFLREAVATTAGHLRYAKDHQSGQASYFLLRRNVHRLEKGLIMRPRRPVFAADYIGETVAIFARAMEHHDPDAPLSDELAWAVDVLRAYFATVEHSIPAVTKAHARFQKVMASARSFEEPAAIPYRRKLNEPPSVDFASFMALCRRRRSVRWYRDRPVPRQLIDQAFLAAGQAPSACNRQPFYFRVFDDQAQARKIAAIPGGTKGFAEHLPAVAVVVGRLRAYPFNRDRHCIYVDGSLAAMSFMFAMESMGLATCSINWPDQEPHESKMRDALKLDADERVIMLIAFGWPDPDGLVPYSAKRGLDELRMFN